jgi:hypothetical protein
MPFPLSFLDISLWFAVMSITLIITSEFVSPYYGRINLLIDQSRLRKVALLLGMLFVLTALLHILGMALEVT